MAKDRRRRSSPRGVLMTALTETAVWYLFEGRRTIALTSRGPDGPEVAARVRRSVERTFAEGTAAVRFAPWVGGSMSWSLEGPDGRIDFRQQRSQYAREGSDWRFASPGLLLIGEPGKWEVARHDSEMLFDDDPFWLLELIAATVEATDEGSRLVRGTRCKRYLARADFALAASNATRPMEPLPSSDVQRTGRLLIEVLIDGNDRIRRARLHRDRSRMLLELFDFGAPGPIDLPGPNEIVSEDIP
jgi:hypothetical protein